MWSSTRTTTRPGCRITCSSLHRSRSCVASWKVWSVALVFPCCERIFFMSHPDIPLRAIDHVRFFVGNARQSAYFYRNAFGFDVIAYAGLETKTRHEAGYVLRQGDITFVLASPLSPEHPDSYRVVQHGDGVQDIALEVEDVSV